MIHLARRAREFGFETGHIRVDFAAIQDRQLEIVRTNVERMTHSIESNDDIELFRGEARFLSPTRLSVGDLKITAEKTIIATGAAATVPHFAGLDDIDYLVSDDLFKLRELPEHIVFIGAGAVAMEFSQIFRRFGSRATVVLRGDRILRREDEEIALSLEAALRAEGIDIRTRSSIVRFEPHGEEKLVVIEHDGVEETLEADAVVIAAGRRAFTDRLGLDRAGVNHTPDGIVVSDGMQTTAANIWAAGDVLGGKHVAHKYTHIAVEHGLIAAENAVNDAGRQMSYRAAPGAVFTDPEVASVGLTEQQALEAGYEIQVGRHPVERIGRARVLGDIHGLIKTVAEAKTGKLLGMHICAHAAGELIHGGIIAMNAGDGVIGPLVDSIFIHPTMMEGVQSSAEIVGSAKPARMSH